MAIQFPCSQCEKLLSAAEDAVGKPIMCSDCGKVTHVPDPTLLADSTSHDEASPQYHVKITQEFTPPISLKQIESQTGWAILVTLCFMPLAIVGMILGSMAKAEFLEGNYSVAERHYKKARLWTTVSLGLWAAIFFSMIFAVILPALKNLPQ